MDDILLWYLAALSTVVTLTGFGWWVWTINETITFILMNDEAKAPEKSTGMSAGYDLRSIEDCVIKPGERSAVRTGVKIVLPSGTYGRIASRSGLSFKHGVEVGAGVVDADYENEIMVILHNHGSLDFKVEKNHRIAQLVVERISYCKNKVEVFQKEKVPCLTEKVDGQAQTGIREVRGAGGLGSTGVE